VQVCHTVFGSLTQFIHMTGCLCLTVYDPVLAIDTCVLKLLTIEFEFRVLIILQLPQEQIDSMPVMTVCIVSRL
jgi:hypothetical protein